MRKPLVMVADDDLDLLKAMEYQIEAMGYRVQVASNREETFRLLAAEHPTLLLVDLQFGDADGVEVLGEVRRLYPNVCVVLCTAHSSIETAVAAMRKGAFDYLTKPIDLERLRNIAGHAVNNHVLLRRLQGVEHQLLTRGQNQVVFSESPSMQKTLQLLENVATKNVTVLLLGESGTGKEVLSRFLHQCSDRKNERFVAVNMAALPAELVESILFGHEQGAFTGAARRHTGYFESADGGTLFLDEIGDMDLSLQARLLRFLQEREVHRVGSQTPIRVDARVIAATNRDLAAEVREGRFREDLYYRLNVFPIQLPALRERRQDIPLLANHFLERAMVRYEMPNLAFSEECLQALQAYDWPGNVRELENMIERLAIISNGTQIDRRDLPDEIQNFRPMAAGKSQAPSSRESLLPSGPQADDGLSAMKQLEKAAILEALEATDNHVQSAAEKLGLSQATLYRKIKSYGISLSGK